MMNLKVFPATILPDGKKVPLVDGWQSKATNDPGQIKIWQQQFGSRLNLWGVPTGDINGLFALDIDVKNGVNGFDKLKEKGVFPEPTAWQKLRWNCTMTSWSTSRAMSLKSSPP